MIAFIVACVSASKMSSKGGDGAAGFMAVWTCILLVVISVIGTIIMRRYQTALSIGFLIGVIFIMTQQMLILFAIFADQANNSTNTLAQTQSQQAMAVFAFFLFLVYAAFGSMLSVFRQDVIKQDVPQSDGMEYDQQQQGGYEQQGAQDGYHDESQI